MPGGVDPILLSLLIVALAAVAWLYLQVKALNQRVATLEREYLALVSELEDKMYRSP